jgi:hypothetical protein
MRCIKASALVLAKSRFRVRSRASQNPSQMKPWRVVAIASSQGQISLLLLAILANSKFLAMVLTTL